MKQAYVLGGGGKSVNLYLDPELKAAAQALARDRYKTSLSNMVEMLLRAELDRKRGVRRTP